MYSIRNNQYLIDGRELANNIYTNQNSAINGAFKIM